MNIVVRTILISMLLLATPLRDALANVGCSVAGVQVNTSEDTPTNAEIVSDHSSDEAGGMAVTETVDPPEEADEAVIESDRHAAWAGPGLPDRSVSDDGPQCATAQATRPPNSI